MSENPAKFPVDREPLHTEGFERFDGAALLRCEHVKRVHLKAICNEVTPICHELRGLLLRAEMCFESEHVNTGKHFIEEMLPKLQTALKSLEGVK